MRNFREAKKGTYKMATPRINTTIQNDKYQIDRLESMIMRIEANGIQINYELSGKEAASVVVLSHSLHSNWEQTTFIFVC